VDFVMALAARQRYAEAFAVLDEAQKQLPEDARLIYQAGRLAAISGQQLERGLAALDQVRARGDKPDDYAEGGMLWRRAQILEKLGRRDEALADYRRAGVLEPALAKQVEEDIARLLKG
jgi:tetratricopeptide (TPR) repeat protein